MKTTHLIDKGYSIREARALYGLTTDTLYYYEEKGLVSPERDKSNGYRIYTARDFWKLNVITELRTMGFSLDAIKRYFENHSLASTMQLLNDELAQIETSLTALHHAKTDVLDSLNRYVTAVTLAQSSQTTIMHIPDRPCLLVSRDAIYYEDMPYLFAKRAHEMDSTLRTMHSTPCYVVDQHHIQENGCFAPQAILLQNANVTIGGDYIIPGGLYAACTFRGAMDIAPEIYETMSAYIHEQGYEENGMAVEFCLVGEYESDDKNEYVSRLEIPVTAR